MRPLYSLSEQVFHCDDALHSPGIFIEFQTISGHHCKVQGALASCLFLKCAELVAKRLAIGGTDGEIILAELHLANVDDAVSPVYDHVNLRPILLPATLP